jgi:hypothetical protein
LPVKAVPAATAVATITKVSALLIVLIGFISFSPKTCESSP